jgi:adenylate cyclase
MPLLYRFGNVEVHCAARRLLVAGQPVAVGARPFDLLVALIERRDRVVSKDELLAVVWPGMVVEEANIQVQVSALRKCIGRDALATVAGRGYRFSCVLEDEAATLPRQSGPRADDPDCPEPPLPDKPSVAVLPFANLSEEAAHGFFAEGVTQDVITLLSRFRSLFVIAHNSTATYAGTANDLGTVAAQLGVRYVVEGGVRRAAHRVVVTARLCDTASGRTLWAERYDRVVDEIFSVQDEVTQCIVTAIAPEIAGAELAKARRHRPAALSAYEMALRAWGDAWAAFRNGDKSALDDIVARAEQALSIDPASTLALNCIALACWQWVFLRSAASLFDAHERGLKAARRAIAIDPTDGLGYVMLGTLLAHVGHVDGASIPYDEALDALETAHQLNPNDHFALRMLGLTKSIAGRPREGIEHLLRALRLNPRDPYSVSVFQMLATACFIAKAYDEGARWALRAHALFPNMANTLVFLAQNYVGLGDIEQARSACLEARRLSPEFVDARTAGVSVYRRAEDRRRGVTFLRIAAGLEDPAAAEGL